MLGSVLQQACRTSLGTENFFDDRFASNVKFVLALTSGATANDTNTVEARLGIGMTDGVTQSLVSVYNADAVADSLSRKHQSAALVGLIPNGSNFNPLATAAVGSTGTQLNFTAAGAARLATLLQLGGSDLTVRTVNVDMSGTANRSALFADMGGTPTLIFCQGHGSAAGTNASRGLLSFGVYDPAANQYRCLSMDRQNAAATETLNGAARTDCIAHDNQSGYTLTLTSVNATGFTVVPSANAGTDRWTFTALYLDGGIGKVGTFMTPTAAGEFTAVSGVAAQVAAWGVLTSRQTAVGSGAADEYGQFGLGFAVDTPTGIQQGFAGLTSDAGAAQMVNKSRTSDTRTGIVLTTAGNVAGAYETEAFTADGQVLCNANSANGTACVQFYWLLAKTSLTPSITEVPDLQVGETAVITGVFPTPIDTVFVGGVELTIDDQDGTTVTVSIPSSGDLLLESPYTMTMTSDVGTLAFQNVRFTPADGYSVRNITFDLDAAYRIKRAGGGSIVGLQAYYQNHDGDLAVFEDGSYQGLADVGTFTYKLNDGTGWGTTHTVTRLAPIAAPVFTGEIPNVSYPPNTGVYFLTIGQYWTGAEEFSATGLTTGITQDPDTGAIRIDTALASGDHTLTGIGTNSIDDTPSNPFLIRIATAKDVTEKTWDLPVIEGRRDSTT